MRFVKRGRPKGKKEKKVLSHVFEVEGKAR